MALCNVAFWCGVLAWRFHAAFLRGFPECHAGMPGVLAFSAGLEMAVIPMARETTMNNYVDSGRSILRMERGGEAFSSRATGT